MLSTSTDSVTSSPPANSATAPLSAAGSVVSVDATTGEIITIDVANPTPVLNAKALSPLLIAYSPSPLGRVSEGVNRFNSERTALAGVCKALRLS